jgi:hypothetical protein
MDEMMNDLEDDFDYDHQDDNWDDPNLYLPNYFVTCFDEYQLPVYQAAVAKYAIENPEHGLEIDTSGKWNDSKDPALLCYDRGSLHRFWDIFEAERTAQRETA